MFLKPLRILSSLGKKTLTFPLCQRKLYSPLKQHVCLQREMSLRITIIWLTLSSELYTHCSCISMTCFSESETKVNICNFSFNDLHGHYDCLAVLYGVGCLNLLSFHVDFLPIPACWPLYVLLTNTKLLLVHIYNNDDSTF